MHLVEKNILFIINIYFFQLIFTEPQGEQDDNLREGELPGSQGGAK